MTISSENRKAGPYIGNGATTSYAFAFKVFQASELLVVKLVSGVESTLVLGTDYTVTLNADQNASPGGTITLTTALPSSVVLVITSDVQNLQPMVLTNVGAFYPEVVNNAMDRATIQIQQVSERLSRAVKTPITSSLTPEAYLEQLAEDTAAAAVNEVSTTLAYLTARDNEIEAQVSSVAASFNIRTWTTGQSYGPGTIGSLTAKRDAVLVSGVWYVAAVEHVAGASFATDLAAGKWLTTDSVQLRGDLADTGTGKGMEMIPSGVLPVADYATLKAKAALGFTRFYVTGPLGTAKPSGIAGYWQVDSTDSTSAENGGTILVQGSVRIKREYIGELNVLWFEPSASGWLAVFKLAVAATPVGGTLNIPKTASEYLIDTSGGLSSAIEINKKMTVVLDGEVKSTFGAIQNNPPTIFYVTADDVTFNGSGKISGDGATNSVNTGSDSNMPSLIRVTGDRFVFSGPSVYKPHKIGIHLVGSNNSTVTESRFTGGPTEYTDTAYFAIRAGGGGGGHNIVNNVFAPAIDGGMYVNCVFFSGMSNCSVSDNVCVRPYEKLMYGNGSSLKATSNTIIGNTSMIPGTTAVGTVGVTIRIDGPDAVVVGNTIINAGGIGGIGAKGCIVTNNLLNKCGAAGIAIFAGTDLSNSNISDNIIIAGNSTGQVGSSGIYVGPGSGPTSGLKINNNTVSGFSLSNPLEHIAVWSGSTNYPKFAIVKPTIGNGRYYMPQNSGGISGGTEPVWPTTPGDSVLDGTILWVAYAMGGVRGNIEITGPASGQEIVDSVITGNYTVGGPTGIRLERVTNSDLSANKSTSSTKISETLCSGNSFPTTYQAGAWTPVVTDGTTDASMGGSGSNAGFWVRNGRQITVTANVATTSVSGLSSTVKIKGLPFPATNHIAANSGTSIGYGGGMSITSGNAVAGYVEAGTSHIVLTIWSSVAGVTSMTPSQWTNSGSAVISATYFIDSDV